MVFLKSYKLFEAMGTLSNDDVDTIEDLCLEFSEKWNLKGSWDENEYEPFEKLGYISIQRFDKYHIQFGVQLYTKVEENLEKSQFESDLRLLLNRISKFGFSVIEVKWGNKCYYGSKMDMDNNILTDVYDQYTYNFQISHTDDKSRDILNEQDYINDSINAIGTLSQDDTDTIEDLCLEFSEKWNLSFENHDGYGYISIQRFDKFHIQFGVQTNISFELELGNSRKMLEEDLNKVVNRIEKFGYNVLRINSGSQINGAFGGFTTYSFQISRTDGKSEEILSSTNESFLTRKEHYINLCWYNAEIGDVLSESDIYCYVEQLHRNEEDFTDGDIGQRIEQFSKYKLMEIPIDKINIDEYDLDIDYMKDYKKMFKETNNYPPIVLDGDTQWSYKNNYTIIDGTHRVNAIYRAGLKTVNAWVGIS